MADNSMTRGTQFKVPVDLLRESHRAAKPKSELLRVDNFKSSWLTRLSELIVGKE